jgi:ribonuclease P/MRP protein subunit POP5
MREWFGICAIPVLAIYQKNNMIDTKKQKILLPTLKERQRYLVYSIKIAGNAAVPRINEQIIRECNSLLGVFDAGKAGIMNVKYDDLIKKGILRVENKYVDKIKVCLGMITAIQDKRMNIDCIYVSGMLNKAEDAMKKDNKKIMIMRGVKNE